MGTRRMFGAVVVTLAVLAVTLSVAFGASARTTAGPASAPTIGGLPLLTLTQVLDGNPLKLTQLLHALPARAGSRVPRLQRPKVLNQGHSCEVSGGSGSGCVPRACREYIAAAGSCSAVDNYRLGSSSFTGIQALSVMSTRPTGAVVSSLTLTSRFP